MNDHQRSPASKNSGNRTTNSFDSFAIFNNEKKPYNIIPIQNQLSKHPAFSAVVRAFFDVSDLPKPPNTPWLPHYDIFDWLRLVFGFQFGNVDNQREHLLLLLSNAQMRLDSPLKSIGVHHPSVVIGIRNKLLDNYTSWCNYLGFSSNICSDCHSRRDLLYCALFLLIWGEAANLRFMPEFLCFVFHNLARELNLVLEDRAFLPAVRGENWFLNRVVTPVYKVVREEAMKNSGGKAKHTDWRNYDDLNEFFWNRSLVEQLGWPMDESSNFFQVEKRGAAKVGFVEQRSFWNVFRSFDRIWVMLVLFLQAGTIVAWQGDDSLLQSLSSRDVQVYLLTVFITWAGFGFLQSVLDAGTQYGLLQRDMFWLRLKMALKSVVSASWIVVFVVLYLGIQKQKDQDGIWTSSANKKVLNFVWAGLLFMLPKVLSVVLFIIPSIGNYLEKSNWKIFSVLTWWFQSRTFIGKGLREGLVDSIKYSLFWIVILAIKFVFSYYLQIKPMIMLTKAIYHLQDAAYRWHQFFGNSSHFAVFLLWLPVVLIYLIDIQIWYSIIASFVGVLVGSLSHIGDIQTMAQLRLRFLHLAGAVHFNLFPEEQHLRSILKEGFSCLKLRCGIGTCRKIESDQVVATKFALIWNGIIQVFREEDIVSDRELELLELPSNAWNIRVIRWPCFLLCNELLLALDQAKEVKSADEKLWRKICKNEYRRCAVIEVYDSVKFLILQIVKEATEEHSLVAQLFSTFDDCMRMGKFTAEYQMPVLESIHAEVITLLETLLVPERDANKIANILQTIYEIVVRDFPAKRKTIEQLKDEGLVQTSLKNRLFENAIEFPSTDNGTFYKQVRRLHTILMSRDSMNDIHINMEAQRRISFFANSLFMNMPRAPQVEKMRAFSVLTPYYNEEILYSKDQLRSENEDGVSLIFYLQKIYADDWANFLERMRREGMTDEDELWSKRNIDLRLWASYRGQTLSRTVRGMMYYYRALKMQALLDSASDIEITEASREIASAMSSRRHENNSLGHDYGTAMMKYTFVVACQIYESQKAKKDPRAEEILYLMKNNEALRVAYVDEVQSGKDETTYYSVLVKYDQQLEKEVEIYRIQLPGPMKLGEGKPENQNHALIFTRGDAVQTIDMNQDGYFEEALKMRNLLEEFSHNYGRRKPTILGVREHVYTDTVSSLARFMSSQETSFVTLGQRVLANPLKIRMHYGHPDVFDRLWILSRGGVSKGSRVINISEDIFAGFNCTLRGGNITHHEYIQVGKGRDLGINQISTFVAKVASGNGEQTLSRDVYRLGQRLGFFRMLSFFYTTMGFYFNTMMVIVTAYAFVWGHLYLAVSGLEEFIRSKADSISNVAMGTVLSQQFVIQLGLFSLLPLVFENSIEHDFLPAMWNFLKTQLQLESMFKALLMGTKAHYYGRTILHGGAKYMATGRGFVIQHKKFAENYRLYARSHFTKAIELGVILTVYAAYSGVAKVSFVYIVLTLPNWFLVVSWIISPFAFNPSGFDWLKLVCDFDDFMKWIWYPGGISAKSDQCWETWWLEEQDHLRTTGLWGKLMEVVLDLRFFFFQYGIAYQLYIAHGSLSFVVHLLSWICIVTAMGMLILMTHTPDKYAAKQHIYYRLSQTFAVLLIIAIVLLLKVANFPIIDILTSLLAFIPTGWGLISIAQVFRSLLESTIIWKAVVSMARLYDILFGLIVMSPVAVLSWLPVLRKMQTRILFNEAFSKSLQISRIITSKKPHVIRGSMP